MREGVQAGVVLLFPDKAGLFQALVHEAHDERYRLMREAAARTGPRHRAQLVEILMCCSTTFRRNRS